MLFHRHSIELTQDIVVVHAHFIFCGIAIVVSVISIIFSIRRVERYTVVAPSRITHGAGSSCSASSSSVTVVTQNKPNKSRKTIKSVQRRIIGLGIACAVLLIFNVVKVPRYAPLAPPIPGKNELKIGFILLDFEGCRYFKIR